MSNSKPYKYLHLRLSISFKFIQIIALAAVIILPSFAVHAVGFSILNIPNTNQPNLAVGVWYPSEAIPPSSPNTPFHQALSMDAEISVTSAPLVILSHGFGGWLGGHADTALALAEAGFVVAAPSHTGNTYKDMSSPIDKWLLDRPKHVSTVIDHLREQWKQRSVLENTKIGVFGFSAGGHTTLSLIGAVPNLGLAKAQCDSNPEEFVCRESMVQEMVDAQMGTLPASAWGADSRISAAAIAAPGLGIAYDQQALVNVKVPVQLWSGLVDDRVPHHTNVQTIADALGELSENHWIEDAGHFAFMIQSCTEKLKEFEPDTWAFLCVDKDDFNRQAFHQQMNAEIARFFKEHL